MRDLKIKLLEDVSNKGKGSVLWAKGNRAARLIAKGKAEIAKDEDEIKVIDSKALAAFKKKIKSKK